VFGFLKTAVGALFGGSKPGADNVMQIAKGVGGWVDGLKLTDQERMEFNGQMLSKWGDWFSATAAENTERSRTRRDIAIWIIRAEISLLFSSVVIFKFDKQWSEYIFRVATGEPMSFLVLGVGAFFFGAHLVRQFDVKK